MSTLEIDLRAASARPETSARQPYFVFLAVASSARASRSPLPLRQLPLPHTIPPDPDVPHLAISVTRSRHISASLPSRPKAHLAPKMPPARHAPHHRSTSKIMTLSLIEAIARLAGRLPRDGPRVHSRTGDLTLPGGQSAISAGYIQHLQQFAKGTNLPFGIVREATYWALDGVYNRRHGAAAPPAEPGA